MGDSATKFALQFGFKEENLTSNSSSEIYLQWKKNNCQPNYWVNVSPDPKNFCGPYYLFEKNQLMFSPNLNEPISFSNHDTIGMVVIDQEDKVAAGTSTNGLKFKIAG